MSANPVQIFGGNTSIDFLNTNFVPDVSQNGWVSNTQVFSTAHQTSIYLVKSTVDYDFTNTSVNTKFVAGNLFINLDSGAVNANTIFNGQVFPNAFYGNLQHGGNLSVPFKYGDTLNANVLSNVNGNQNFSLGNWTTLMNNGNGITSGSVNCSMIPLNSNAKRLTDTLTNATVQKVWVEKSQSPLDNNYNNPSFLVNVKRFGSNIAEVANLTATPVTSEFTEEFVSNVMNAVGQNAGNVRSIVVTGNINASNSPYYYANLTGNSLYNAGGSYMLFQGGSPDAVINENTDESKVDKFGVGNIYGSFINHASTTLEKDDSLYRVKTTVLTNGYLVGSRIQRVTTNPTWGQCVTDLSVDFQDFTSNSHLSVPSGNFSQQDPAYIYANVTMNDMNLRTTANTTELNNVGFRINSAVPDLQNWNLASNITAIYNSGRASVSVESAFTTNVACSLVGSSSTGLFDTNDFVSSGNILANTEYAWVVRSDASNQLIANTSIANNNLYSSIVERANVFYGAGNLVFNTPPALVDSADYTLTFDGNVLGTSIRNADVQWAWNNTGDAMYSNMIYATTANIYTNVSYWTDVGKTVDTDFKYFGQLPQYNSGNVVSTGMDNYFNMKFISNVLPSAESMVNRIMMKDVAYDWYVSDVKINGIAGIVPLDNTPRTGSGNQITNANIFANVRNYNESITTTYTTPNIAVFAYGSDVNSETGRNVLYPFFANATEISNAGLTGQRDYYFPGFRWHTNNTFFSTNADSDFDFILGNTDITTTSHMITLHSTTGTTQVNNTLSASYSVNGVVTNKNIPIRRISYGDGTYSYIVMKPSSLNSKSGYVIMLYRINAGNLMVANLGNNTPIMVELRCNDGKVRFNWVKEGFNTSGASIQQDYYSGFKEIAMNLSTDITSGASYDLALSFYSRPVNNTIFVNAYRNENVERTVLLSVTQRDVNNAVLNNSILPNDEPLNKVNYIVPQTDMYNNPTTNTVTPPAGFFPQYPLATNRTRIRLLNRDNTTYKFYMDVDNAALGRTQFYDITWNRGIYYTMTFPSVVSADTARYTRRLVDWTASTGMTIPDEIRDINGGFSLVLKSLNVYQFASFVRNAVDKRLLYSAVRDRFVAVSPTGSQAEVRSGQTFGPAPFRASFNILTSVRGYTAGAVVATLRIVPDWYEVRLNNNAVTPLLASPRVLSVQYPSVGDLTMNTNVAGTAISTITTATNSIRNIQGISRASIAYRTSASFGTVNWTIIEYNASQLVRANVSVSMVNDNGVSVNALPTIPFPPSTNKVTNFVSNVTYNSVTDRFEANFNNLLPKLPYNYSQNQIGLIPANREYLAFFTGIRGVVFSRQTVISPSTLALTLSAHSQYKTLVQLVEGVSVNSTPVDVKYAVMFVSFADRALPVIDNLRITDFVADRPYDYCAFRVRNLNNLQTNLTLRIRNDSNSNTTTLNAVLNRNSATDAFDVKSTLDNTPFFKVSNFRYDLPTVSTMWSFSIGKSYAVVYPFDTTMYMNKDTYQSSMNSLNVGGISGWGIGNNFSNIWVQLNNSIPWSSNYVNLGSEMRIDNLGTLTQLSGTGIYMKFQNSSGLGYNLDNLFVFQDTRFIRMNVLKLTQLNQGPLVAELMRDIMFPSPTSWAQNYDSYGDTMNSSMVVSDDNGVTSGVSEELNYSGLTFKLDTTKVITSGSVARILVRPDATTHNLHTRWYNVNISGRGSRVWQLVNANEQHDAQILNHNIKYLGGFM